MESKNSGNFDFGANLLSLREKKLLSQEELGAMAGVTGAAIGQYERNEITPRKKRLVRLAAALGVSVGELNGYSSGEKHTSVPKVGTPTDLSAERYVKDLQKLTEYQEKRISELERELKAFRGGA